MFHGGSQPSKSKRTHLPLPFTNTNWEQLQIICTTRFTEPEQIIAALKPHYDMTKFFKVIFCFLFSALICQTSLERLPVSSAPPAALPQRRQRKNTYVSKNSFCALSRRHNSSTAPPILH